MARCNHRMAALSLSHTFFLPPQPLRHLGGLCCAGMLWLALCAAADAQMLRPGLWEFDGQQSRLLRGKKTLDMQKIQSQVEAQMRGMDAEARRILEENLRSSGIAVGQARNTRLCVPPEQANLPRLAEYSLHEGCQFKLVDKGADFVRGELQCTEPAANGTQLSTLITPERVQHRTELQTAQGRWIVNTQAQWLSSDCGTAPVLGTQSLQGRSLFEFASPPPGK